MANKYIFNGEQFTADEMMDIAQKYPHLRDSVAKAMLKSHYPGGEALPGAAAAPNAILERSNPNFKVDPSKATPNERKAMRDNAGDTTMSLLGDLVQGGVGLGAARLAGKIPGPIMRGIATGLGLEGGRTAGNVVRGKEGYVPPSIAEGALEGSAVIPGFIQKMLQRGVSMARHEKAIKDLLRAQGMGKDRISLIMQQIADFEADNKSRTAQLRADEKLVPQNITGKKAQLTQLEKEIEDVLAGTPEYSEYQKSQEVLKKLDVLNKHGGARMNAERKLAERTRAVAALRSQYRKDRGYVDLRKEIRDLEKLNANMPQNEADLAKWGAGREAFMKKNKITAERDLERVGEDLTAALKEQEGDNRFSKFRSIFGGISPLTGLSLGHYIGSPVVGGVGLALGGAALADKAITGFARSNAHRPGFAKAVDRNTLQKLFGNIAPIVEVMLTRNRSDEEGGGNGPAGELIIPE